MTVRRRSSDTFMITIELGTDSDGKRLRGYHTLKGTKKEALTEERRLLTERDRGTYAAPSKLTVEAFLSQWVKDHAAGDQISARTAQGYGDMVRLHIGPAFRDVPLSKLRPKHLQDFYTRELESGRLKVTPKAKKGKGSHLRPSYTSTGYFMRPFGARLSGAY
jgi:integrase